VRDERELIPHLKKQLETNRYHVKTRVSLPRSRIDVAYVTWKGKVVDRFAQPDIDILYVHPARKNTIYAAEVKYFKRRKQKVNYPFYEGIDEALALLRFGVDRVSLWHYFEESIDVQEMKIRASNTRNLIERLGLPIGYKCSQLIVTREGTKENMYAAFFLPEPENPYSGDPEARLLIEYIKNHVFKMLPSA